MKRKWGGGTNIIISSLIVILKGLPGEPVHRTGDQLGLEDLTELKVHVDLVGERRTLLLLILGLLFLLVISGRGGGREEPEEAVLGHRLLDHAGLLVGCGNKNKNMIELSRLKKKGSKPTRRLPLFFCFLVSTRTVTSLPCFQSMVELQRRETKAGKKVRKAKKKTNEERSQLTHPSALT